VPVGAAGALACWLKELTASCPRKRGQDAATRFCRKTVANTFLHMHCQIVTKASTERRTFQA
jgi:hypothetical protein